MVPTDFAQGMTRQQVEYAAAAGAQILFTRTVVVSRKSETG